jgi:hypothetical protein
MLELNALHKLSSVFVVETFESVIAWGQEKLLPDVVHVVKTLVKIWVSNGSSEKSRD